ncbi:cell division protein SepF [Bacillaceae bacterium W0354]
MRFKDKFKSFFDLDEYNEVEEPTTHQSNEAQVKDNVISLKSVTNDAKMVLCELTSYDDSQTVADHLKKRKSVVINLQRLDQLTSRRVIDFLSGTVYAINGNIQKLGQQTFLCTPEHVNISGSITDFIDDKEQMNKGR